VQRSEALPQPQDVIPVAGFRARRWNRFERELRDWIESPDGRFAAWRAQQAIGDTHGARD
jgi:hypothetical protein